MFNIIHPAREPSDLLQICRSPSMLNSQSKASQTRQLLSPKACGGRVLISARRSRGQRSGSCSAAATITGNTSPAGMPCARRVNGPETASRQRSGRSQVGIRMVPRHTPLTSRSSACGGLCRTTAAPVKPSATHFWVAGPRHSSACGAGICLCSLERSPLLDEGAVVQLGEGLPQLGLGVHHDRAVPGDRLLDRLA
jgi:hypothetical protein